VKYFTCYQNNTTATTVLWRNVQVNMCELLSTAEFCWSSFIAHMPLFMATNTLVNRRKCSSSSQWCYLYLLHTVYLHTNCRKSSDAYVWYV